MSTPTNADDVVRHLRASGQPLMAIIVETLQANYRDARAANVANVDAINALRERYEPRYRSPSYKSPSESDG